jgi:hypothetical protein
MCFDMSQSTSTVDWSWFAEKWQAFCNVTCERLLRLSFTLKAVVKWNREKENFWTENGGILKNYFAYLIQPADWFGRESHRTCL